MSRSQKNNIIIGSLIVIVVIMVIAYAAFASNLSINGTSNITSNWDIEIISVTPDLIADGTSPNYSSCGDIAHSITGNNLTANFSVALISPGDSVEYTIEVQNKGSLNAVLSTLTKTDSNNEAITFEIEGIEEGDSLAVGETKSFTATVTYESSVTSQPTSTTSSFGITLDYVQGLASGSGNGGGCAPDGIVYAFNTTENARIGQCFFQGGYVTDYSDLNEVVFNKYVILGGLITEGYSCHTFGILDEPVCLKYSSDGLEYGDENTGNVAILKELEENQTFINAGGYCVFGYIDGSYCSIDSVSMKLYATIYGQVEAYGGEFYPSCSFSHGSLYSNGLCFE